MIKVVSDIKNVSDILEILDNHSKSKEKKYLNWLDFKHIYQVYQYDYSAIYLVVKYVKSLPVSGLPLVIDKTGTLRFVNDNNIDVYERVGYGFGFVDFKRLARNVESDGRIKRVELKSMVQSEDFIGHMRYFFGIGSIVSSETACGLLQRSNDQFIGHLRSKQRSELRRIINIHQNVNVELVSYPSAFPQKELEDLVHIMVSEGRRKKDFLTERNVEYLKRLFFQGKAEFLIGRGTNSVEVINILLKYSNSHVMFWVDLYRNKRNINLFNYIEFIFNRSDSYESISFGRGLYSYKMRNFEPHTQNLLTFRYSKRPLSIWFHTRHVLRELTKQLIRR